MLTKILALAGLIILVALLWGAEEFGYGRAEKIYLAKIAATEKANDSAIAEAYDGLEKNLDQVKSEKESLEHAYDQLVQAAHADPDAGKCGISRNSVQRLNAIH